MMAPSASRLTFRNRQANTQPVKYLPIDLPPAIHTSLDFFPPKLQTLKDNLKATRQNMHDLEIQDAEIRHQLAQAWDSLPHSRGPYHDRHKELATSHREWYHDLRSLYRQRIQNLEKEIAKETNYTTWRSWSQIELLLRWKSGQMDYSIFKDSTASQLVRASFELEAGLELPDEKVIKLVSAQVAAGWYKTPIESRDWLPRKPELGYVDRDFPGEDGVSTGSVYVEGYKLRNTFVPGSEFVDPREEARFHASRKGDHWIYERGAKPDEWYRFNERPVYTTDGENGKEFYEEPSNTKTPHSKRPWADRYPRKSYSEIELENLATKANTPVKPKKWVNITAGRISTRRIIAEEYVD
ncbi:hypothetical protein VTL71DRAFT_15569 [Oculimacula yallundae]|uniref:Uncharacterized protein n=1 Tax=Oculimacula yallundae TaxID=86028 RepID=A0ABR4CIB3_9HELO